MADKVVTRFAPSPTGYLHLGNYRTALFGYLYAKQNGGEFILRIEDTDTERSKKEFEDDIIENLSWLKLAYDRMYRQSERTEIHKTYLKKLIDSGAAYLSKETIIKDGDRAEVIRFKNPNTIIEVNDIIRGKVIMNTNDLGDFVIAKSLDEPLFHLAVVVDDFEMGVTHIIRGEDHLSNTPRHILLQRAIGAPEPVYAHLPMVLTPERTKLSKRSGAMSIGEYREWGYLPEVIINMLALIGWNPGTEQEIFSLTELIATFSLNKVQKSGAIFNEEKLKWLNSEYLKKLLPKELADYLVKFIPEKVKVLKQWSGERFIKAAPTFAERLSVGSELSRDMGIGEWDYLFAKPEVTKELLIGKSGATHGEVLQHINTIVNMLENLATFDKESVKEVVWPYAETEGKGKVLWPMRVALSGKEKSPDPFTIAEIIGKEETLLRLRHASTP